MDNYSKNAKGARLILGSFAFVWEQRKVGELASDTFGGGTPTTSNADFWNGSIPWIQSSDLTEHQVFGVVPRKYISKAAVMSSAAKIVPENSIAIITRVGVGKLAVMPFSYSTSQDFLSLSKLNVDVEFAAYLLYKKLQGELNSVQGTSIKGITKEELLAKVVSVPERKEQEAIGQYFHNLDRLITLHQRNWALLFISCFEQVKSAESHYSDGTYSTWEQRKLGELASVSMNRRIFKEQTTESGDIPFFKIGTFGGTPDAYISQELFEEYRAKYPYPKLGDILISASGSIGRTVEYSGKDEYFQDSNIVWLNHDERIDNSFLKCFYTVVKWAGIEGSTIKRLYNDNILNTEISLPITAEQKQIGAFFHHLDHLITLHQRNPFCLIKEVLNMLNEIRQTDLFCEYYAKWIAVYKKGAIRKVTMDKYIMTHQWLVKLAPNLKIADLNRLTYQQILNDYAIHHERQTTMDFHHQLKGALLDAVDEGLIERDPTRKAIIKGKAPNIKKIKYINQFELHTLLSSLELKTDVNWDWFILIVAKTGMRFSEALALTPKDFDFAHQTLSIGKTWDYKSNGGFLPTKNKSSVRKIQIDWQTVIQFSELVKGLPESAPIFVNQKVYNSTVNDILARHCKKARIPVISVHGLRHTHASLLLFAGVSIASVARRLGHASMTTTQKTYLHIIQELENKDVDLVMRSLSGLS